jgi:hypothetical protein
LSGIASSTVKNAVVNRNDFVKNPDAALRCILRHCGVRQSTPHSSGFARLACGTFYEVVNREIQ